MPMSKVRVHSIFTGGTFGGKINLFPYEFLAALLSAYLSGKNLSEILDYANHMGAFVAGKEGAIPKLDAEQIKNW